MRRRYFVCFLLVIGFWFIAPDANADTIYTNDGGETRGIVVEDYNDRIVMSTVDGEISILKSDIRQLYYDSEADNLVKLAEQARERGDIMKAFAYYDMAYKFDPNSKAAKDGIVFLQGYLFRKEQVKKEDEIKKQEEFENFGVARIEEEKSEIEKSKEAVAKLREVLGITLSIDGSVPVVNSVISKSPAYEAGIIKGDTIVSIWGRLCGYMRIEDIVNMLLEKPSVEIKCGIERMVTARLNPERTMLSSLNDILGALFRMEFDGLTVFEVKDGGPASEAGFLKNDLIITIDGKSTRYLPLNKAVSMMRKTQNDTITFRIRRELIIWRKI